jgi:hypothetical protein
MSQLAVSVVYYLVILRNFNNKIVDQIIKVEELLVGYSSIQDLYIFLLEIWLSHLFNQGLAWLLLLAYFG